MKNTIQKTLFDGKKSPIQGKMKISSSFCHRCEHNLTNKTSIGRGYGPVCWRKLGSSEMEREFMKAGIKRVPQATAGEIFAQLKIKKCWCGEELIPEIWADTHQNNGWTIPGFEGKPWLFIRCSKCHKDIALWKLGYVGSKEEEGKVSHLNVPTVEQH